jgi:hypothetical protein
MLDWLGPRSAGYSQDANQEQEFPHEITYSRAGVPRNLAQLGPIFCHLGK